MALAATAAATLGAALLLWRRSASKSAAAAPADGIPEAGSTPETSQVGREKLIRIFQEITNSMQQVMVKLAQIEQQLKMNARQQGKEISDADLHQYLMKQFEDAMNRVEQSVYQRNNTTEAEVQQAAEVFAEDAEFKTAVETLKSLFKVFTGQTSEGDLAKVPERLDIDLVLSIMEETMDGMSDAMEESFAELKEGGMAEGSQEFNTKLQTLYTQRIAVVRADVQEKYDIKQAELHAGVIKYQSQQRFQEKMYELTKRQKERFAKLGVRTAM